MSTSIDIEAEVLAYKPGALHEHYEGGQSAIYDATELRIRRPDERAGATLLLFHSRPPEATSPWRQIGARLRFVLGEEWLAAGTQAFAAAAEQIQLIGAPDEED